MANKFDDCSDCLNRWTHEGCAECGSGELFEENTNDLNGELDFGDE